MAYLSLYRKWRPSTFKEIIGQKHISIPILRAFEQNRLAHAYLFSGPRGTGKTSMARILAKAVNCLDLKNGNPCNECANCKSINTGASMDVYEIDGASARGVDEIRVLRESVRTLPVAGNKKVYIIDEVHMLTKEAFNALLKTLEEPPAHVLFILATTEPAKIPLTILSRCQRYEFHRISVNDIKEHLLHISQESHLSLTTEAAALIAVRAEGGLRDALSLLDQCSGASAGNELSAEIVYDLLGLTDKEQIIDLFHMIVCGKSSATLQLFYKILQDGKEPSAILSDLLEHFRSIMICKVNPNAPELSAYGNKISVIQKDAQELSDAYLDALFDSLHHSFSEANRSSSPRMSAEMGLLRLCRLRGSQALDSLEERITALEKNVSVLMKSSTLPQTETIPAAPSPAILPPTISIPLVTPTALTPTPAASTTTCPDSPKEVVPPPPADKTPVKMEPATKSKPTLPCKPKKSPEEKKAETSHEIGETLLDPSTYNDIWAKVLAFFEINHRIDILYCLQKSSLILLSKSRAIAVAPQPYLVLAGNNKGYQNTIKDAFINAIGIPVEFHSILKGTVDEADALRQVQMYTDSAASVHETEKEPMAETADSDYRLVEKSEIPDDEKDMPALAKAFRILSDCDIYEKK